MFPTSFVVWPSDSKLFLVTKGWHLFSKAGISFIMDLRFNKYCLSISSKPEELKYPLLYSTFALLLYSLKERIPCLCRTWFKMVLVSQRTFFRHMLHLCAAIFVKHMLIFPWDTSACLLFLKWYDREVLVGKGKSHFGHLYSQKLTRILVTEAFSYIFFNNHMLCFF